MKLKSLRIIKPDQAGLELKKKKAKKKTVNELLPHLRTKVDQSKPK